MAPRLNRFRGSWWQALGFRVSGILLKSHVSNAAGEPKHGLRSIWHNNSPSCVCPFACSPCCGCTDLAWRRDFDRGFRNFHEKCHWLESERTSFDVSCSTLRLQFLDCSGSLVIYRLMPGPVPSILESLPCSGDPRKDRTCISTCFCLFYFRDVQQFPVSLEEALNLRSLRNSKLKPAFAKLGRDSCAFGVVLVEISKFLCV